MEKITDVLKYEGDNYTFIWKHPSQDFNCLTQLIVHESQEAVFFMDGQIMDVFGPGRYTLETQNIPLISKLLNRFTGDTSPFHCEVYFINKAGQMNIKWGTDTKVQYMEPIYGFPISIGASGEMILQVEDGCKLLLSLAGAGNGVNRDELTDYFRGFLMAKVKTYIAQTMRVEKISIFQIDENLNAFSQAIHKLLIPDFADYGLCLDKFFVTTIVKPDGDKQYEKFKEIYFRQYADSQAQAAKREQEGYTYAQERSFDVAQQAAKSKEQSQAEDIQDFRKRAEKLKIMKDTGLISDEEFAKIKQQMISQIL